MLRHMLVLVAALGLATTLHAADAPCDMKLVASLEVSVSPEGAVLVPVSANGREVWMILALNQGLPALFAPAVDELKIPVRKAVIPVTSNGKPVRTIATVPEVLVGRLKFDGLEMLVAPTDVERLRFHAGKPVIGTLSSRPLQSVDLELNLAGKKVNLFSQTRCHGGALYWGGEYTTVRLFRDAAGLMLFPMELDGKLIETSFNTTSRDSRISSKVTKRYFGFDESSRDIQKETSGLNEVSSYQAMALTAKGLEVKNSRIRLVNTTGCEAIASERPEHAIGCGNTFNNAPFSIGTELLSKLRVYVATKEEMVYFTRAESSAQAPSTVSQ